MHNFFVAKNLKKTLLFYRDFQFYTGGHQKIIDYFEHTHSSKNYQPFIAFSENTKWDKSNPWLKMLSGKEGKFEGARLQEYIPSNYDALFIAGLDWRRYLDIGIEPDKPVINLIQHVRHADPNSDVYPFLKQRAVRICVAQEVADAIKASQKVNGPVYTVSNGHLICQSLKKKECEVFILATKNHLLGNALVQNLTKKGLSVSMVYKQTSRKFILEEMAKSKISVLLPNKTEGFYLPALEAMALSDLCVVPDCIGNRGFCSDKNCLMPEYDLENIVSAVLSGLAKTRKSITNLPENLLRKFYVNKTLRYHSLERERKEYFEILDNLEQIW